MNPEFWALVSGIHAQGWNPESEFLGQKIHNPDLDSLLATTIFRAIQLCNIGCDIIGSFILGKIRRVLNKTRTFRINGTVRVLCKTRLIFPRKNGPTVAALQRCVALKIVVVNRAV